MHFFFYWSKHINLRKFASDNYSFVSILLPIFIVLAFVVSFTNFHQSFCYSCELYYWIAWRYLHGNLISLFLWNAVNGCRDIIQKDQSNTIKFIVLPEVEIENTKQSNIYRITILSLKLMKIRLQCNSAITILYNGLA